ncbi:MAG: hypothetical protein H6828_12290 [Planctomycetes bacterium]|nr:hypothetical protein [Planctomycetota bacterium]
MSARRLVLSAALALLALASLALSRGAEHADAGSGATLDLGAPRVEPVTPGYRRAPHAWQREAGRAPVADPSRYEDLGRARP